mgnify:CR=1 FL=1
MFTLEDYLTSFTGSLIPHTVLAVYLFVIMGTRGRRVLKKLPALLLSPLLAVLLAAGTSSQLRTVSLLHDHPRHPADVYLLGSVGVADRILACLFRCVHGRRVPDGHILPIPNLDPIQ